MDSPLPKLPTADEDFLGWLERQAAEDVIYSAADLFPQAIEYARSCEKEITQLRADLTAAQEDFNREKRSEWREGIVAVIGHDGNYLGCMGTSTWAEVSGLAERLEKAEAVVKASEAVYSKHMCPGPTGLGCERCRAYEKVIREYRAVLAAPKEDAGG